MSATLFLEGGGDSNDLRALCRQSFRKLLERCSYRRRMPALVGCGGRNTAFDRFKTALSRARKGDFVALWIDSEDPVEDLEDPWGHLKVRDGWDRPAGAADDQVLLMATCMETWLVADRTTLNAHFGSSLQESALPPLHDLEARARDDVLARLIHATRNCRAPYRKGKVSFEILAKLVPATLEQHLPSFVRVRRILDGSL